MSSFSSPLPRSPLGHTVARWGASGRAASAGLLLAALVGLAACNDDEGDAPAEPTGVASIADVPDASVRELPGDGLEPTPDIDIERRQRDPIGPQRLNEMIDRIQNGAGGSAASDAGPSAAPSVDAGADGST